MMVSVDFLWCICYLAMKSWVANKFLNTGNGIAQPELELFYGIVFIWSCSIVCIRIDGFFTVDLHKLALPFWTGGKLVDKLHKCIFTLITRACPILSLVPNKGEHISSLGKPCTHNR